ncbi:hypothetical protein CSOJ01_04826 [Colletotrichum sojae]|uniref:Uncharacterized protein n=1 Tax=Colletotrichum sojae TaxID=2175907 RepID=A0A8H6JI37_9PEZI|nr:hypothetical protein CSOJ01_04826 [Colletotrichum sojae]
MKGDGIRTHEGRGRGGIVDKSRNNQATRGGKGRRRGQKQKQKQKQRQRQKQRQKQGSRDGEKVKTKAPGPEGGKNGNDDRMPPSPSAFQRNNYTTRTTIRTDNDDDDDDVAHATARTLTARRSAASHALSPHQLSPVRSRSGGLVQTYRHTCLPWLASHSSALRDQEALGWWIGIQPSSNAMCLSRLVSSCLLSLSPNSRDAMEWDEPAHSFCSVSRPFFIPSSTA